MNKVPALAVGVRMRSSEPVAYAPHTSMIYEFNRDADALLRLVDGNRSVAQIAAVHLGHGAALRLAECQRFFDECVALGLIEWN